jgi:hypothetical protein
MWARVRSDSAPYRHVPKPFFFFSKPKALRTHGFNALPKPEMQAQEVARLLFAPCGNCFCRLALACGNRFSKASKRQKTNLTRRARKAEEAH